MSSTRDKDLRTALFDVLERLGADLEPLERVEDIPRLEAFAEEAGRALIDGARSAGASWADIAERLGVSRQAVHKRFTSRGGSIVELRFERRKR